MGVRESQRGRNPSHPSLGFGDYEEVGKTEARQEFLRLVDELQEKGTSVAITDRGQKVAVMMGFKQYEALISILKAARKPGKNPLAGSIQKVGDLDKTTSTVHSLFEQSVKKSAESI